MGVQIRRDGSLETQPVSATKWGPAQTGLGQLINTMGDNVVYTPGAGLAPRLLWLGLYTPSTNTAAVIVTIKIGSNSIYKFPLGAIVAANYVPDKWQHSLLREGNVGDTIVANLSAAQSVYINLDCVDFLPA